MAFDKILQEENLTSGVFTYVPYTRNYPLYLPVPGNPVTLDLGVKQLGRKRVTQCNKGTGEKFRPGKTIKNAPICHQEYVASASHCRAICFFVTGGKSYQYTDVSGPLGLYLANPSAVLDPFVPFDSRATEALVRATSKSNSAQAELGVMLAEAGETLKMLTSPFTQLPKVLKKLRRPKTIRRPTLKSAAGYSSDAWLTYRYGIRPLLSDIDTIRNLVNKGLEKQFDPFRRERASIMTVIDKSNVSMQKVPALGTYLFGGFSRETIQKVSSTCYFSGGLSGGAALGVDVSSIPLVAWELVPYSFVVDWFVDVGGWLSAIIPKPGITQLANCVSTMTRQTGYCYADMVCAAPTPSSQTPMASLNATLEWKRSSYMRGTGFPLPSLPVVNVSLESWKRRLDGVSLLYQKARRFL